MTGTIKAYANIGDRILKDGKASPGEMGLYYSWPRGGIYTEPLKSYFGVEGKKQGFCIDLKWENGREC